MVHPVDLDALTLFHAVAAHGGFGRAARFTKRAKTTLSRRVSDLEIQLGVRLFERGSGSPRLTEEGRALLASTQEPLDELAAAEGSMRGGSAESRGRLRVSVPLMFGQQVMGGLAARFLARHPMVRLEIVADDRYVDLVEEGFDVAIRAKPKPEDELVGRCVLRDRLLVVASPAMERPKPPSHGEPARVAAVVRAIGEETKRWISDWARSPLSAHPRSTGSDRTAQRTPARTIRPGTGPAPRAGAPRQIPIARARPHRSPTISRFRPLEVFGRRPRPSRTLAHGPASENLHRT